MRQRLKEFCEKKRKKIKLLFCCGKVRHKSRLKDCAKSCRSSTNFYFDKNGMGMLFIQQFIVNIKLPNFAILMEIFCKFDRRIHNKRM